MGTCRVLIGVAILFVGNDVLQHEHVKTEDIEALWIENFNRLREIQLYP